MPYGMVGPIVTEPKDHLGLTEAPNYNAPFEAYAPAVLRQAQEILSVETIKDYAHLGRVRGSESENIFGQAWDGFYGNEKMVPESRIMDPEEATQEYGFDLEGNKILNFKEPVSIDEAKFIRQEKIAELDRLKVIDRIEGFWPTLTMFSLDIAADFVDPLGLAALFIPPLRGVRTFKKGFAEGAFGIGIALTPGVIKSQEMQSEWGVVDTMFAIGLGGTLTGGISKSIGKYIEWKGTKIETEIQKAVDEAKEAQPELEGNVLEKFRITLGEVLETGEVNSFNAIDNITTLQEATKKQQELKEEVSELIEIRKQVLRHKDSSEKADMLAQINEAIKDNREKSGRLKPEEQKPTEKPTEQKKPEQEYGPEVKVTRLEESLKKESTKGKTRAEVREIKERRNADLQKQLDIIIQDPTNGATQNRIRKALRKLLSESPDPIIDFWLKTAPYEHIDVVIKRVRDWQYPSAWSPKPNWIKEGWEIKEGPEQFVYEDGVKIREEPEYRDWQAKIFRDVFRDEIKNFHYSTYKGMSSRSPEFYRVKWKPDEPRNIERYKNWEEIQQTKDWEAAQLNQVSKEYQDNLDNFKGTANRAATDEINTPTIIDEPDVPNNYGTVDTATAAAEADTLTIISDITGGEATTPDELPGLILQAQKTLKTLTKDQKTDATELRKYIAKLTKMQRTIARTQEQLKRDPRKNIEDAGNCIDDVPF